MTRSRRLAALASSPESEAFSYLAQAIVRAGGEPPLAERAVLLGAARGWGLSPARAVAILRRAADPAAEALDPPSDSARREEVLSQAAAVAMADGRLVESERKYLSRLARGLGYGAEEVREALRRAKAGAAALPARPRATFSREPEPEPEVLLHSAPVPAPGRASPSSDAEALELAPLSEQERRPDPIYAYICRTPSGAKLTLRLYPPELGFEVDTASQTVIRRYEDVLGVTLGLHPDGTSVCGIHLRNSPSIQATSTSTKRRQSEYDYLAFVRKLHVLLGRVGCRPQYRVARPGGAGTLWLRALMVGLPAAALVYWVVTWALRAGDFLEFGVAFLVSVVAVVAAGSLLLQALTAGSSSYQPPDFPASVLPGAEDLTVAGALGKGGAAAVWVIATVMQGDDD